MIKFTVTRSSYELSGRGTPQILSSFAVDCDGLSSGHGTLQILFFFGVDSDGHCANVLRWPLPRASHVETDSCLLPEWRFC